MSNERTESGAGKNKGYMTMTNNSCYGEALTGPVIAGDKCAVTTIHNNIFHTNCTRMFDMVSGQKTYGVVNTSYNNWVTSGCATVAAMLNTVVGTSPGWVNGAWPLGDFHLAAGSQCINAGNNSVGGLPTKEYVQPCAWTTRATDGAIDIGAHEYGGGGGLPPVANFTGNPTSGVAPLAVAFTDTSTNTPTSWSWAFGDGGTSTAQNPSHTYAAGTYTVSLTATNAYGSDGETKTNYITATTGGTAPVANFTGNPTSGTAPLTVMFTDTSTNTPTSWSWTFGDGGTSTAQNPSHIYAAGTFTVSLTATNAYGSDSETKTGYITANAGGGGDFFCATAVSEGGIIQSGTHTNLHASDDSYLVVLTAKLSGSYGTKMRYTFTTGLGSLSSLSITSESHPSAQPQRQRIYARNFTTGLDVLLDDRNLTSTSDTTTVVNVSSPAPYLSAGQVQVYVRTGDLSGTSWTHSIDFLKITAAP
jgi:PKD repeat protein